MPDLSLQLQTLISTKKYSFSHIAAILQQLQQQSDTITLQKKSIMVLFLSRYFHLTTQNWMQELQKLKYQICYAPLMKNQQKKIRNIGQYKRKQKKANQQIMHVTQLSIHDIMNRVEEKGRMDLEVNDLLITPKKEPIFIQNRELVTIPPFQPDFMAQIGEQISNFIKSQSKDSKFEIKQGQWNPDLLAYQNVLALTQKGINLTVQKKRMSRTKKKDQQRLIGVTDDKIYLTQGDDRIKQLELLTTKVKITKQKTFEDAHYFTNQINKVSLKLKNSNLFVQQLKIKKSQIPILRNQEIFSPMFSFPLNFMPTDNEEAQQNQKNLFVNEENHPSHTKQLQEVIKFRVDGLLQAKREVSLRQFSQKYGINREIKGELFYQLMQMGYKLSQKSPQTFGDILIERILF